MQYRKALPLKRGSAFLYPADYQKVAHLCPHGLKKRKNIKNRNLFYASLIHLLLIIYKIRTFPSSLFKLCGYMKNGNRKFYRGEVTHVYQRAVNGFNIFYQLEDYLVFYTIFSVFLRRFKITAIALCLMIDHFHALLICESKVTFSRFIGSVTSLYSRLFNATLSRKGQLFDKSYGSAPKIGEKQIRAAILYVFNNATEKNICVDPIDYMLNFLAYMQSDHPFSEKFSHKTASQKLINARKEVAQAHSADRWLNYAQLFRLYKGLSLKERQQLTDFIIVTYLPFDNTRLLSYFKSLEMMKLAIISNTGSEYSIREEFNPYSDLLYNEIFQFVREGMGVSSKSLLTLPLDEKICLANKIAVHTHVPYRQIAKFLHIPLKK